VTHALGRCALPNVWMCFGLFLRMRNCGGEEEPAVVLEKMDGVMRGLETALRRKRRDKLAFLWSANMNLQSLLDLKYTPP